jgi:hypothetical protein
LAGTIYEDFLSKLLPKNITEKTKCAVLKLIVITTGILCLAMNFVVDHLGGVIPLNMAIVAISNGPLLGVFTVGLLFPRVRAKASFFLKQYPKLIFLLPGSFLRSHRWFDLYFQYCNSRQILSVSGTDKRHYQTTFY